MAFELTASYLARGLTPVTVVPGFENVLSNAGTTALGVIPQQNSKLGFDLASAALQQAGTNARQEMVLDAARRENELNRKADRKFAGMKLASALMGSGLSGGGKSVGVDPGDPLAMITELTNFDRDQTQKINEQRLPVLKYAEGVLKSLG